MGLDIISPFVLGLLVGPFLASVHIAFKVFYFSALGVYLGGFLTTAFQIYLREKKAKLALLAVSSIIVTHFVYGILFIGGFFTRRLKR